VHPAPAEAGAPPSGMTCSADPRRDGSYDFNCDGESTRSNTETVEPCNLSGAGKSASDVPDCGKEAIQYTRWFNDGTQCGQLLDPQPIRQCYY
jgi:hypothetical protein